MKKNKAFEQPNDELWARKWEVFKKRSRLFNYVPFVEFVLVAGSIATGKVREESDFDVILGVREGRIFSAWFFSAFLSQLLGWREHPGTKQKDKLGLSHFVAQGGYKLTGPYNAYWQNLYQNLIPAMGDEKKMADFFEANDWVEPKRVYKRSELYLGNKKSLYKRMKEFALAGKLGDWAEKVLKKRLVEHIEDPKKLGHKPRVYWDDTKLELYRDTERIDKMLTTREL